MRASRRGLLLGLHVEARHRRRGVGRVLARAAAARGGGFSWSANPPDEPDAAAFWAKVGASRAPRACARTRKPRVWPSNPAGRMVVAPLLPARGGGGRLCYGEPWPSVESGSSAGRMTPCSAGSNTRPSHTASSNTA